MLTILVGGSYTSLRKQPHRGWSVGRAGLASEASLPCLRHAKRKQGRRSWSLQSLSVRRLEGVSACSILLSEGMRGYVPICLSPSFRGLKQTNPDGVEWGRGPLRQGRLISFANPALPTDQPLQGCFLSRLLHSFSLLLPSSLLTTSFSPPYSSKAKKTHCKGLAFKSRFCRSTAHYTPTGRQKRLLLALSLLGRISGYRRHIPPYFFGQEERKQRFIKSKRTFLSS